MGTQCVTINRLFTKTVRVVETCEDPSREPVIAVRYSVGMLVRRTIETLQKSAGLLLDQARVVEAMRAKGTDTSEAELLLGCYAAAHRQFEKCLQRAIIKREEAALFHDRLMPDLASDS
jgi:hypothetical protein